LHSKERVPYHIIIEVAYDKEPEVPKKYPTDVENNDSIGSSPRIIGSKMKNKQNSISKTLS
jgi:hypothetical protein